jgi:hypothetical protein
MKKGFRNTVDIQNSLTSINPTIPVRMEKVLSFIESLMSEDCDI